MNTHHFHNISVVMVIIGLCLMIVSVGISLKINKIANQETKRKWTVITNLMILFLLGYSSFLYLQFQSIDKYLELITGIVFLGGSLFVMMVIGLIQNTLVLMNSTSLALKNETQEHKLLADKLRQSQATMDSVFNSAIPVCITGKDFKVMRANKDFCDIFGHSTQSVVGLNCYESHPSDDCNTDSCPLTRVLKGEKEVVSDMIKHDLNGQKKFFIVTSRPFINAQKEVIGIVESFQDITERELAEKANEDLINELQDTLKEVNILSGLIPICASCKNIRDDKGYWKKIESYIRSRSNVKFSHGICPDCAQKLYPDLYNEVLENNN